MATTKTPAKNKSADKPKSGEADVTMQRIHPNSRANVIADLALGDSIASAKRIVLSKNSKSEVNTAIENLKSTMNKAAMRATQRSGLTFTTEVGQFMTRSGDIIAVAVVTRTE